MSDEKLGAEQGHMKRTAEQVVSEWRSTGSTDWGQLVSAINYWAITDMCPALREPGADTGTTPPIEELISKWSNELVYSLDEAEIDLIEKIAPLILRDMAAAERGTTPEGLAFTFEEFIDMSLRHNKRLAAGISGIASFGHWYNEMLAATQRAPVEQGERNAKTP